MHDGGPMTPAEKSRRWRENREKKFKIFRERGAVRVDVYVAGDYSRSFKHSLDEALKIYYQEPTSDAVFQDFIISAEYLDTILASGEKGRVARHIHDPELGTAIIEVIPYHCQPCLVMALASPGTLHVKQDEWQRLFAAKDDRIQMVIDLDKMQYDWDTPLYRQVCAEFDMNPDYRRPIFGPQYDIVGQALMTWAQENHSRFGHRDVPQMAVTKVKSLVNDIVDLIRNDEYRDGSHSAYQLKDELDRIEEFLHPLEVPFIPEIRDILEDPPKNHTEPGGNFETIEFLTSPFGTGFNGSFYSYPNTETGDGWKDSVYGHIGGIAVFPDGDRSWSKVIVKHLTDQGVIFLTTEQAEHYSAGEGVYWGWKQGLRVDVGMMQRTLWTIKAPETPLGDEAVRKHQAAMLLRGRAIR